MCLLLGYCHLWQYPTTKQVVAPLVPLMVAWFKAFLSHHDWQVCWRSSPCLPIKEAIIWEQRESERQRECVKRIERKGEELQQKWAGSWVEWMQSSSSMYLLYPFSIFNKMNLSRGCRQFAEPRKILSQCAFPSVWAIISTSPVGFPNRTLSRYEQSQSGQWIAMGRKQVLL